MKQDKRASEKLSQNRVADEMAADLKRALMLGAFLDSLGRR